jgi:phenylalanyl-tRNA synthetase beta chain
MLANLAEAAQRNADHGAEEVRLFEAGPVYVGDKPGDQRLQVAAVVRPKVTRNWQGGAISYDAFAAKADLLALMAALDQPAEKFQVGAPEGPHWHPGRAATLRLGPKTIVATFGELHPGFLKQLKCDAPMLAIEVNLEALPLAKAKTGKTKPKLEQADQTPIRRDFAFVVDEKVPAGDIVRLAAKADPKLITHVRAFDVFQGPAIGEGKKSIAIEVTIQPRGEAMKDEQIDAIARSVVQGVGKGTGAVLRG